VERALRARLVSGRTPEEAIPSPPREASKGEIKRGVSLRLPPAKGAAKLSQSFDSLEKGGTNIETPGAHSARVFWELLLFHENSE
jgi:hypothetical protein